MTQHISTRKKLVDIADVKTFNQVLDLVILTPEERKIMELKYLQGKSLLEIGFELNYTEVTICRKHQKILKKISKILK